MNKLFYY